MSAADDVRARVADLRCLGPEQAAELTRIVQRLVDALQPERIYMFGSQARGDASADSDVDLMVIVPADRQPRSRLAQVAQEATDPRWLPLDLLVLTREEASRFPQSVTYLPAIVQREGVLVYAAA